MLSIVYNLVIDNHNRLMNRIFLCNTCSDVHLGSLLENMDNQQTHELGSKFCSLRIERSV